MERNICRTNKQALFFTWYPPKKPNAIHAGIRPNYPEHIKSKQNGLICGIDGRYSADNVVGQAGFRDT